MTTRFYSSTAVATALTNSVNNSQTTIVVDSAVGFPLSYPYTLSLDDGGTPEELVSVTGAASTTLTVTRAYDGTAAANHNAGAVVRHVSAAIDFTDSRNHENSNAQHGATGAVVGTTNTQTLTNKTLTAPVVNNESSASPSFSGTITMSGSPTVTGTIAGTPTFSGAVVFTGNPLYQATPASTQVLGTIVSGDSSRRLVVDADGTMVWGPGNATQDTNLYRSATDTLKTDDSFVTGAAITSGTTVTVGTDLKLVNGATTYRNALSSGPTTVANTTTETVIATATIPANDAVANAIYRMVAYGHASSTGTPNFSLTARLGGVAGTSLGGIGPSATATGIATRPWKAEALLRVVSTGASASWSPFFLVHHTLNTGAQVGQSQFPNSVANITVDSTVSEALVITWTWGTASASNTATCIGVIFERVA